MGMFSIDKKNKILSVQWNLHTVMQYMVIYIVVIFSIMIMLLYSITVMQNNTIGTLQHQLKVTED